MGTGEIRPAAPPSALGRLGLAASDDRLGRALGESRLIGWALGTSHRLHDMLRGWIQGSALARHGETPCSGREAYARYSEVALQKVQAVGGKVLYLGRVKGLLIAPADEQWDEVLLVRYPSAAAFAAMLAMPDYMAATRHRTAALDNARLIATVEAPTQAA